MSMHVVKLDRRYDGHDRFSHRVEFIGYGEEERKRDRQRWIKIRNWLWQQFGPSAELFLARADNFDGEQPKWAWDAEKYSIYVKEEAFTMFQLRKEFWDNAENL